MLFQDATIVNGMVRTKDSYTCDESKKELQDLINMYQHDLDSELSEDEPNKKDIEDYRFKIKKAKEKLAAMDSIYDNYTYKGIEYERKDLWEKLKQEGKTKRFFTLSEKEKLGKDGQYIIYQAPSGELFAVTRDTNDGVNLDNPEELKKEISRLEVLLKDKNKMSLQGIEPYDVNNRIVEYKARIKELTKDIKYNNTPDSEFDKDELALGIKTEMEHTDNKEEAESIAKDHLQEDEKYYTKLVKMEAKDESPVFSKGKYSIYYDDNEKEYLVFLSGRPRAINVSNTLEGAKEAIKEDEERYSDNKYNRYGGR